MAVYTIELDSLIKSGYDIGLADYPLPNFLRTDDEKNAWRDSLNKKIIAHYRFNEICCTSPDRFKHFLNTTMNEIMPLKNLMYQALNGEWEFEIDNAKVGKEKGYQNRTSLNGKINVPFAPVTINALSAAASASLRSPS